MITTALNNDLGTINRVLNECGADLCVNWHERKVRYRYRYLFCHRLRLCCYILREPGTVCWRVGEIAQRKFSRTGEGLVEDILRAISPALRLTTPGSPKIMRIRNYRIARKFCGSFILRIGDFLWFAGTKFCGSRRLKFLLGTNFCDSLFKQQNI